MKRIYLITGEASGDLHGSHLAHELRRRNPDLLIDAVGGERVRVQINGDFTPFAHLNVTGFTEVLAHLPEFLRLFKHIGDKVRQAKPDLIVFIDNPGFNLRLAAKLQSLGIPMVYYICPQVWAWNEKRLEKMKRLFVDHLVIFDFEETFYRDRGVEAHFVGHPLKDELNEALHTPVPKEKTREPLLLLLPGSRRNEVSRLLPVMLEAAARLKKTLPQWHFALLQADTLDDAYYAPFLKQHPFELELIRTDRYAAMRRAQFAWVCSGTATLETALFGLPMIIVYKVSAITAIIAKKLVKLTHVGLPNVIARHEITPELIQEKCTPERLCEETHRLLKNQTALAEMRQAFASVSLSLGQGGAAQNAASRILSILK